MFLIIGANGFLGSYILKNIIEKTNDNIIAVARNIDVVTEDVRITWISCDISDYKQVDSLIQRVQKCNNIKVIYLAAYHNPDLVEKNPQYAWNINVTSLSYFINHLDDIKCFFYPSTDSVYGNSINGYRFKEDDKRNPVNAYGKQKCAAESVVTWYGYNVIRYPFLVAPSVSPIKKHFYDVIEEQLSLGNEMEMFVDSYRSSLSFDTAASILIDLIENYSEDIPKVLNVCGDDALSKYDIGLMIADKIGADRKLVVPVCMDETSGIFDAKRAQSTLMDNTCLKKLLGLNEIKLEL